MQLNHALSTTPDNFCLQLKRMYYPLHIKATCLSISTVTVGTWVIFLKCYNRGLSSTNLKPIFRDLLLKTEVHSTALACQSKALNVKLLFRYRATSLTKHVNTMMVNFPFLPEALLLFISPPLKPLTSKLPNQIYVNKKNLCMA